MFGTEAQEKTAFHGLPESEHQLLVYYLVHVV